jgi:hypothetical protein
MPSVNVASLVMLTLGAGVSLGILGGASTTQSQAEEKVVFTKALADGSFIEVRRVEKTVAGAGREHPDTYVTFSLVRHKIEGNQEIIWRHDPWAPVSDMAMFVEPRFIAAAQLQNITVVIWNESESCFGIVLEKGSNGVWSLISPAVAIGTAKQVDSIGAAAKSAAIRIEGSGDARVDLSLVNGDSNSVRLKSMPGAGAKTWQRVD